MLFLNKESLFTIARKSLVEEHPSFEGSLRGQFNFNKVFIDLKDFKRRHILKLSQSSESTDFLILAFQCVSHLSENVSSD